jgi:heptaprenyl diphosphate synthase
VGCVRNFDTKNHPGNTRGGFARYRYCGNDIRAFFITFTFSGKDDKIKGTVQFTSQRKAVCVTKIQKLTRMALLTAIALIIFIVEARIPAVVPLPGVKLGLANIVTVFAVFLLGPGEAAAILACRIFLGAVFAGNFSTIFYSAAGGGLAIGITILLRKCLTRKQIWVAGCLGAMAHSVGQVAMAILLTSTPGLIIYLPPLIAISIVTGLFTGLCAQFLVNRGKDLWKITSK